MENFDFKNPTRIIFGKDVYDNVGELIKKYGNKVLIHCEDGKLIKKIGIYEKVIKSIEKSGIEYIILEGVVPNPRLSLVYKGIEICKKNKINFILAIGGGSVIDSAKAISLGSVYDGDVWDFFTGKAEPKDTLGVGVILTIPGAGSEMSESAVISNEELKLKSVCDTERNFPKFSILDPQVCYTIPKKLIACGVVDIMSHLMERYFSQTQNTRLGDGLLEATMRVVIEYGRKVLEDKSSYNDYEQIMWSATIAHNGMISAGRVSDWTSHRIEHEISALYNVTHGAGMAVIFPAWLKYVKGENKKVIEKFAKNVFLINESDIDETINKGIESLEEFFKSLGLKIKLSDLGIGEENFELMAEKALCGGESIGKFKKLKREDIINILKLAK